MSLIPVPAAMQAATRGFYPKTIEGSLRFNDDDSAYLSYVASSGSRTKFTISCWTKIAVGSTHTIFGGGDYDPDGAFRFFVSSSGRLNIEDYDTPAGSYNIRWSMPSTGPLLRDPSAWYHIVLSVDTTLSTPEIDIYINGEDWGSYWTKTNSPSQNDTFHVNISGKNQYIGYSSLGTLYADGYMAEYFFLDGQVKQASDFGETKNGVWVPKNITASNFTMGTNGFHLTFEDDTEVEAFNTVLYRGDGSGNQSITGMGMNADLYWIKRRDAAGGWNCVDTVRGPHKRLELHGTGADYDQTLLQSFDSDGFTTGVTGVGVSGGSYVAFGWDAGANNASTGHSSVTYVGSGTDNMAVSGLPFSPDLLIIKERNGTEWHNVFDTVRGSNKMVFTNATNAEVTDDNRVTSFTNNGFKVGTDSATNTSGDTYVAWAWDAGDSDAASNTDGSITSTVKSNGDFSIISYTGTGANATVGHGLTSAPDFVIYKNRDDSGSSGSTNGNWIVQSSALGVNGFLELNDTSGEGTDSGYFNSTRPSDTVLTFGSYNSVNGSSDDMIVYAWRNVTGKQKFDTYDGDHTNGVTVNCGFRPGFVMVKTASGEAGDWEIYDSSRGPFGSSERLEANTSDAEPGSGGGGAHVNFTSTGFELPAGVQRTSTNKTGNTYIYVAFAGSYSDFITDYNTDGTNIDSRVKANQTTGFSICSYEGSGTASDSFGHGLGTAPSMVIIKDRNNTNSWLVQHSSVTGYLTLNATNAVVGTNQLTFGASTVTLNGTWDIMNGSGRSYIAYCWAEKTGYSKFGSYTGTGTTTGNTVTLGFRPAFLLIKRTDTASTNGWYIWDGTRNVGNDWDTMIYANLSNADDSGASRAINVTDTTFQPAATDSNYNASGGTYIYAAFADTREAAFWLDQSSNDNDWQPNNLDHNDTVLDSPTNNFCTLNPLHSDTSVIVLSDGNLTFDSDTTNKGSVIGTMGVSSGQFYWEANIEIAAVNFAYVGICSPDIDIDGYTPQRGTFAIYQSDSGNKDLNGTTSAYGDSYTAGDLIGVALDADAEEVTFYKNGTSQGVIDISSVEKPYMPYFSDPSGGGRAKMHVNFGQQPFKYSPPE